VGLNLGALAFLGAILASGVESGGLGAQASSWLVPAAAALVVGTLGFRFPRTVGLSVVLLAGAFGWAASQALGEFRPLGASYRPPTAQPLTEAEVTTAFDRRVDLVEIPVPLLPPTLVRVRDGGEPTDPWWPWAESMGWARSVGAPPPEETLKFGVYRLDWWVTPPRWTLVAPVLTPGGTSSE
jgi:hypothetical protein